MHPKSWLRILPAAFVLNVSSAPMLAQSPTTELETFLYIQDPHNLQRPDSIFLLWIPEPVLKYCLNRPNKECIDIDYCIRTTTKHVKQCQNLPVDISRIPRYSPETQPRRVLGVTFYRIVGLKGWDSLLAYFKSQPPGTFDRLTPATRIKAKVKFTRNPEDDSFSLLEVLQVPAP